MRRILYLAQSQCLCYTVTADNSANIANTEVVEGTRKRRNEETDKPTNRTNNCEFVLITNWQKETMPAIELDDLTAQNKGVLQLINETVLPTRYPQDFYEKAHTLGFSKLAFYGEVPVGAVKAKLTLPPNSKTPNGVYIESLAVLEPYRHKGIGKKLVDFIVEQAKSSYVHEVTLHVWLENSGAIEWYEKLGFTEKSRVDDYYKEQKLENPTAVLLSRKF